MRLKGRQYFQSLQAYVKVYIVFMRISKLLRLSLFKEVSNQEPENFLLKEYLDSECGLGH